MNRIASSFEVVRHVGAGNFSKWLDEMQSAIRGERGSDVPCGTCTACCTSSQFIHVAPDEADTLEHIPADLLFPAPRMPRGHMLLGYDEHGHCPMLIDDHCSIYEHRPRTCRTYDCRVFPAAGIEPEDEGKALIAQQARRWQFSFATDADRNRFEAVRAAARYLRDNVDLLPDGIAATNATQVAVLAIEVHDAFLHHDKPDPDVVRVEVTRRIATPRG